MKDGKDDPEELVLLLEFNGIISKMNPQMVDSCLQKVDGWIEKVAAEPLTSQVNVIDRCVARIFTQTQGKDLLFNLLDQIYVRIASRFKAHLRESTRMRFFDRIFDLRDKDFPAESKHFRVRRCCQFAALACGRGIIDSEFLNAMLISITDPFTRPFIVESLRRNIFTLNESITELILEFTFETCSSNQGVVGMLEALISTSCNIDEMDFDRVFFRACLDVYFQSHGPSSYATIVAYPLYQRLLNHEFESDENDDGAEAG